MRVSAYLSMLDDWNILSAALSTIVDHVDEIIVVDGAYRWMAPFFHSVGRDPLRSRDEVMDVLAQFGSKVRVIQGLWENESEKRAAGYAACLGRYVIRFDADEILSWNEGEVDRMMATGSAVGQMEMPLYVAPGLIRSAKRGAAPERQSFFFDSDKIDPWQHLSYLWLVTTPAEQAKFSVKQDSLIYPTPLAYNAHLTHWRQPESAVSRARFYVLNYVRSTGGLPWLPSYAYDGGDFDSLLAMLPAEVFDDYLLGHAIVACPPSITGSVIVPSPRRPEDEASFEHFYTEMLDALSHLNRRLFFAPRHIVTGQDYNLDATLPGSLSALRFGGGHGVDFSENLVSARVRHTVLMASGEVHQSDLPHTLDQTKLRWRLPDMPAGDVLRQTLSLAAWPHAKIPYMKFAAAGHVE